MCFRRNNMKMPRNTCNNNFYSHEVSIIAYLTDDSDSDDEEYPSPTLNGDFSEYMWMENEEEFDDQVMKELEEEALMEECVEAMLEDEIEAAGRLNQRDSGCSFEVVENFDEPRVTDVGKSTLNPNATEFVPRLLRPNEPVVVINAKA